jgi:hypothetical protein
MRALEALCSCVSHREGLRCRLHSVKARSARGWSSGASGTATKRVRGTQGRCLEPRALPSALLGATRWSSLRVSRHRVRSSISGWRCLWWYAKRASGLR